MLEESQDPVVPSKVPTISRLSESPFFLDLLLLKEPVDMIILVSLLGYDDISWTHDVEE